MRHTTVAMALAVLLALPGTRLSSPDAAGKAAVRRVLVPDLMGQAIGSSESMRLAFRPEALLTAAHDDSLATAPIGGSVFGYPQVRSIEFSPPLEVRSGGRSIHEKYLVERN